MNSPGQRGVCQVKPITLEPSAAVLHEIRAPLGFIVTAAHAAAEDCPEGLPARTQIQALERAAVKLLASAEQVLTVATAERSLSDQPFEPDVVVTDALDSAAAIGQPIRYVTTGSCGWSCEVGNAAQLEAALQSLLNNAVQHGYADGEVLVQVEASAKAFSVTVRNQIRRQRRPGLGIGLNICAQLAERLGGRITTDQDQEWFTAILSLERPSGTPLCDRVSDLVSAG